MTQQSLIKTFFILIHHELVQSFRTFSELLHPLWFFAITSTLFPFAISSDPNMLRIFAPGIIWIAALLSILFSLDRLFITDFDDGSIEQLILSSHSLPFIMLTKSIAHWLLTALPLLIITPIIAVFLHLPRQETHILLLSLLLGTPSLILIGSIGAALTVGLRNHGILLTVLILPIIIPILIFGVGCVVRASEGFTVTGIFAFLAAFLILSLLLAPWATAAALKVSIQ